jgi:hypothetical protein
MATLYKADGTIVENYVVNGLEDLQKAVGGYIEVAHCFVDLKTGKTMTALVNEEGLLIGLPANPFSMDGTCTFGNQPLAGNILLCNDEEFN